jgi:hypothetical protein
MSRYGLDYYGIAKYGAGTTSYIDFDASPFTALPASYQKVLLSWANPAGNWSLITLVRNKYGFPLTIDDGDRLFTDQKSYARNLYFDAGQAPVDAGLEEGSGYYYSLFVFSLTDTVWKNAGNAITVSVKDFEGPSSYDLLPNIYKTSTLTSVTDNQDNDDLEAFLNIFDYELDLVKTYAQLMSQSYDISLAYGTSIPSLMQQFGLSFEPSIGIQRARSFLVNASIINKSKGSKQGIYDFIKSFTGYEPIINVTKNLMLTYNDSSFEESIGNWTPVTTGINAPSVNVYKYTRLPAVVPYSEPTLGTLFPNLTSAVLQISGNSTGDQELRCGFSNPNTLGIPVTSGSTYTFSIYTLSQQNARQVNVKIYWFDRKGSQISVSSGTNISNLSSTTYVRPFVTATAPDRAFFAVPAFTVYGLLPNENHYFDAGQFEIGSAATSFEEARGLKITLKATRVNELHNPSFESGQFAPWSATNAALSIDTIDFESDTGGSTESLQVQTTTSGQVTLAYTDHIPVLGGYIYTISSYIRTAFTGLYADDKRGYWSIRWYDASNQLINTTSESEKALTEYYLPYEIQIVEGIGTIKVTNDIKVGNQFRLINISGSIDGVYTALTATTEYIQFSISQPDLIPTTLHDALMEDMALDFYQISYSALGPDNAAYAEPVFTWTNAVAGNNDVNKLWFDSMMFERSNDVSSYFDGGVGFSTQSDLLWEGAQGASRSHYYKNRVAAEGRLIKELPNHLNLGQTFSLAVAQPGVY